MNRAPVEVGKNLKTAVGQGEHPFNMPSKTFTSPCIYCGKDFERTKEEPYTQICPREKCQERKRYAAERGKKRNRGHRSSWRVMEVFMRNFNQ